MTCATDRGSISMIFISPQMRTLVSITRGTLWSGAGLPPCIPIFMEEQWDCSPCQIRHSCGPLKCPHISISIQFGREKTNNNNKRSSQDWVFKCKRERKGSACLHIVMCKFLPLMVWVLGCAHGGISTSITISISTCWEEPSWCPSYHFSNNLERKGFFHLALLIQGVFFINTSLKS